MNDFAAMNEVCAKYFPVAAPARSTVQAAGLPKDAQVEIELVAALWGAAHYEPLVRFALPFNQELTSLFLFPQFTFFLRCREGGAGGVHW